MSNDEPEHLFVFVEGHANKVQHRRGVIRNSREFATKKVWFFIVTGLIKSKHNFQED